MSRFIDKLKQVSKSEPQPMGFGRGKSAAKPRLLLVAEAKTATASDGADAMLMPGTAKSTAAKTDLPVGIRLFGSKAGNLKGVDFVVLLPEMPVAMVEDEKIGRVMAVEASLEIGLLRALEDLPLDALLVAGDGAQPQAVTWQYLMLCKRISAMSGKPLLAAVPPNISRDELQMVWDTGVSGVVVAAGAAGGMKKLRSMIDGLTLPAKHKKMKARAIVPSISEKAAPAIEDDEDEEEE